MRVGWLLALVACTPIASDLQPDNGSTLEEDGFLNESSVRIISPESEAVIERTFNLHYENGSAITHLWVRIDGLALTSKFPTDGSGVISIDDAPLGEGILEVQGYDANGEHIGSDTVDIRVVEDLNTSWVAIVSPTEGSSPVNPISFTINAGGSVAEIELVDQGMVLDVFEPGQTREVTLEVSGEERTIEAHGIDGNGDVVTTDTVTITPRDAETVEESSFNEAIIDMLESYEDQGTSYYWPEDTPWSGSTNDIYYDNELVADDGGFNHCFCVGMTWELYLTAWRQLASDDTSLNGLSADEVFIMRDDWFVRELDGAGANVAFAWTGLGEDIESFNDFRPGDFVQFWRHNGSGHNVIFIDWLYEDESRVGMEYWSCNGASSTDGPGTNTEFFGSSGSKIDTSLIYGARAFSPENWLPID